MDGFKALTFNAWHGLSGSGLLRFGELEAPERRERRYALQAQAIASAGLDVLFLQELNPVEARSGEFARALSFDECHFIDQAGIKFFDLGLPGNLRSGLAILAKPELCLKFLGGLELSGGGRYEPVGPRASFQLHERRAAVFAQIETADFGRIILANAHLHHGAEPSGNLISGLAELRAEEALTEKQFDAITAAVTHADARRLAEVDRLLEHVELLSREADGCLLGGDFNSTPEGAAYRRVVASGFDDVGAAAAELTWNPSLNEENRDLSKGFELPTPSFGLPKVEAFLREYDQRPRRIDFLFASGALAKNTKPQVSLFADAPVEGLFLSDHFGVVARWPA